MSIFFTPHVPNSRELLAQALGQGVGGGLQAGIQSAHEALQAKKQSGAVEKALGLPAGSLQGLSADQLVPVAKVLSNMRSLNDFAGAMGYAPRPSGPTAEETPQQVETSEGVPGNFSGGDQEVDIANVPLQFVPLAAQISEKRKERIERREQKEIDRALRETKELRHEIEGKGRSADRQLRTLNLMESLVDTKKLSNPVIAQLADKFNMVGLLSPESQIFQKALGQFLPSLGDIYGARVTNQHEKIFLSTLPRLNQTDTGKKKVIKMLRTELEGEKIVRDAYYDILKENKGTPPMDLERRIHERTKEALDKNYEKLLAEARSSNQAKVSVQPSEEMVSVISPDGKRGKIPKKYLNTALKQGYKKP